MLQAFKWKGEFLDNFVNNPRGGKTVIKNKNSLNEGQVYFQCPSCKRFFEVKFQICQFCGKSRDLKAVVAKKNLNEVEIVDKKQ